MTLPKTSHRALASLALPRSAPELVLHATAITTAMTSNPLFPSPIPSLPVVNAAIADFRTAQTAVLSRTRGTVAVRDEKRAALVPLLDLLCAYVQSIADASPENAVSIIESAGMAVRRVGARPASAFEARRGAVSGTVDLVAPSAAPRAAYEWQSSTDGGASWSDALPTLRARTTIAELTPGATVSFRYRSLTRAGVSDWSQTVALIVV